MKRRSDDESGAALVEMAFVVGLLTLLVFGIITFGLTLSFKQSMTQASNEAARAAATAPRDLAIARAETAANKAASGFGTQCNDGNGLTCSFVIDSCPVGGGECMVVELVYDLRNHPRVPTIAPIAAALPDELVSRAVVEVSS